MPTSPDLGVTGGYPRRGRARRRTFSVAHFDSARHGVLGSARGEVTLWKRGLVSDLCNKERRQGGALSAPSSFKLTHYRQERSC